MAFDRDHILADHSCQFGLTKELLVDSTLGCTAYFCHFQVHQK